MFHCNCRMWEPDMELTQTPSSSPAPQPSYVPPQGYFQRRTLIDWLYAAALFAGVLFAFNRYGAHMDVYEKGILLLAAPTFTWLGGNWRSVRPLMAILAVLSL